MLPDSGIGYEGWILIFVIGEPTDTAVVSQGHHSEPHSRALHRWLQLCWAAPDCLHSFELASHPWQPLLHPIIVATGGHSAILSQLGSPKDTSLHPFSGAWLLWLSSPAYPCTHLSDMLPLAWGFPAVFCLSGTGSLPFLLAHRHACHHFSAIFPTFVLHVAIHFGDGICCYFHFFFFL